MRIGIHKSEVIFHGDEVLGQAVIVASGIELFAEPGGTCMTGEEYAEVKNELGLKIEALGEKTVKNVDRSVKVYEIKPKATDKEQQSAVTKESIPSVAVLPFENLSPDPEQEYFCDGVSEEIINALTQINDLKVIARTSAFSFKGKDISIRDIARELDVQWVLEGSVRKAGDDLRITAQLIKVADQSHVFSKNYDRKFENIFAIQDEISLSVVEELKGQIFQKEIQQITKRQKIDVKAYELYLKGWQLSNNYQIEKARPFIDESLAIEPDFFPARMLLVMNMTFMGWSGHISPHDVYPKGKDMGIRALELDESNAEAHYILSEIYLNYDWNFSQAYEHLKYVMELNPGSSLTHVLFSLYYEKTGRFAEAITYIQKAIELDPLSQLNYGVYLDILYLMGDYETFMQVYDKAKGILTDTFTLDFLLHRLYSIQGRYEDALEFYSSNKEHFTLITMPFVSLGISMVRAGKIEDARKLLHDWKKQKEDHYFPCLPLASLNFALGELDEGFVWLDKSVSDHEPALLYVPFDPYFDEVRSDERYKTIMHKVIPNGYE